MKDVLDWFLREYGRNSEQQGDMARILFLDFRFIEMLTISLELNKENSTLELDDLRTVIVNVETQLALVKRVRNDVLAIAKFRIEEVEYEELTTRENITEAAKQKGMNEKDFLEFIRDNGSAVTRKAKEVNMKAGNMFDQAITRLELIIIRLKGLIPKE